jgi:hypothetical protein
MIVGNLGYLAHQATAGHNFVILLDSVDLGLMFLGALLLQTDKEEVENNENQEERNDLHKKSRTTGSWRSSQKKKRIHRKSLRQ